MTEDLKPSIQKLDNGEDLLQLRRGNKVARIALSFDAPQEARKLAWDKLYANFNSRVDEDRLRHEHAIDAFRYAITSMPIKELPTTPWYVLTLRKILTWVVYLAIRIKLLRKQTHDN